MKEEKVPLGRIHIPDQEEEQLPCDVCALWYPDDPASPDIHVMTKREVEILDAMREVKKEAKQIKEKIRSIVPQKDEGGELQQRLKALQGRWRELDADRVAAAEERMRMLGHQGS